MLVKELMDILKTVPEDSTVDMNYDSNKIAIDIVKYQYDTLDKNITLIG